MSIHARTIIRNAVIDALEGNTQAQQRIFAGRVNPLNPAELPALCVYVNDEQVELASTETLLRSLSLIVECYVKTIDDYDAIIDELCAEVENRLYQDNDLNALTKDVHLSTMSKELLKEGEQPVAIAVMTFTCEYTTSTTDSTIIT